MMYICNNEIDCKENHCLGQNPGIKKHVHLTYWINGFQCGSNEKFVKFIPFDDEINNLFDSLLDEIC